MIRFINIIAAVLLLTFAATADEMEASKPFHNMTLPELQAVETDSLTKSDKRLYKKALKAARRAEKARIKAEKKAAKERIRAERKQARAIRSNARRMRTYFKNVRKSVEVQPAKDGLVVLAMTTHNTTGTSSLNERYSIGAIHIPSTETTLFFVKIVVKHMPPISPDLLLAARATEQEYMNRYQLWFGYNRAVRANGGPMDIQTLKQKIQFHPPTGDLFNPYDGLYQATEEYAVRVPQALLERTISRREDLVVEVTSPKGGRIWLTAEWEFFVGYLLGMTEQIPALTSLGAKVRTISEEINTLAETPLPR